MSHITPKPKELEFLLQNEILPIIATYYPYGIEEIKSFFDSREPASFDWVIDVCEHALANNFADLDSAEQDIFKKMGDDSDIEKKALDEAFEVEELRVEVKRLRLYTDQRLFAAACAVVEDWERGLLDGLESDMPALVEAIAWWDSLPFDPDKDTEKLPKYEG